MKAGWATDMKHVEYELSERAQTLWRLICTSSKNHEMLPIEDGSDLSRVRSSRSIVEPNLLYRSLCPDVVGGRGLQTAHRKMKREEKERGAATVTVDACVWRRTVGRDFVPVIMMKDDDTRNLAAHVVSVKAEDVNWVFMRFVCDLERCGSRVGCGMRSDQDTALSGL